MSARPIRSQCSFFKTSQANSSNLQRVQNSVGHVVANSRKRDNDSCYSLHRLPIAALIRSYNCTSSIQVPCLDTTCLPLRATTHPANTVAAILDTRKPSVTLRTSFGIYALCKREYWEPGKEEENKWVFRWFSKTRREGDVMTCAVEDCPYAWSSDRKWPMVHVRKACSTDDQYRWRCRAKTASSLGISWTNKFIGEVWSRRTPVYTFEHEYCEFEVNPFLCLQPVKLTEERSDAIKPRRRVN